MKTIEEIITSIHETTLNPAIHYVDLSREAATFGLRAQVQLERRVLEDYREFDPTPGDDVAEVVLSVLSYDALRGDMQGDSRVTVYLVRRDSGQMVEVDLSVQRRCQGGGETYFLRFIDERELELDAH